MTKHPDPRAALPSVHALAHAPGLDDLRRQVGIPPLVAHARRLIDEARQKIALGIPVSVGPDDLRRHVQSGSPSRLREVLNATGVILHTNLGRAPLAGRARDRVAEAARGASNVELDLETGRRGGRGASIAMWARQLWGAEDTLVVNNGAAALLLALSALAPGRGVVVSRGESVEIGGGFRIPDVITQGGAQLVEVGTTNRTRLSDYADAVRRGESGSNAPVGALLKVHRSNFDLLGFTSEVSVDALVQWARTEAPTLPVLYDQGTGDPESVRAAVAAGAHVVVFSGDKALGGPQAGILVGQAEFIERARRHPLARALRADRLCLAALEATLELWAEGRAHEIPAAEYRRTDVDVLRGRAEAVAARLRMQGVESDVLPSTATSGGGTRPGEALESWAVVLNGDPRRWTTALRAGSLPVVGRIENDAFRLDLRSVAAADGDRLADAVIAAARRLSGVDDQSPHTRLDLDGGSDLESEL